MYGIITYIYPKNGPNVGKYSIHGASGYIYIYMYISIYSEPKKTIGKSHGDVEPPQKFSLRKSHGDVGFVMGERSWLDHDNLTVS